MKNNKRTFMQICDNCGNKQLGKGNSINTIPDRHHKDCPKCRKPDYQAEAKEKKYQQDYFRYL